MLKHVVVAMVLVVVGCKKRQDDPPPTPGRPPVAVVAPVELSILYGSEKKTWLEEQITKFNAAGTKTKAGAAITVKGKALGSGEAMTTILEGTEKPTVFSPASGAYITLINQQWQTRDNHTKPIAPTGDQLVLSPIVIAMWKPMAEALGWPAKPIGWSSILAVGGDKKGWGSLGRPEWGDMKLGHTHPEYSNSGLLSVLAIAYAGAGRTRGLTSADIPKIEPFLSKIEDSIVHYGKSTGFFADKMIERGTGYLSAAVLYENLVIESYGKSPPLPLVAVYPVEGTFWSDHPYSVLDAPWVTAEQREAAAAFLAFLKAKPQQERALALGFRPVDTTIKIGAPVDAAHGVDPQQPQTLLEVPDGPTLEALLAAWRKTKKSADVVVVFDKSGSMKGRPLDEAKRGAKAFLATLDPRDQVSLVFFDSTVYPAYGPVELGKARADLESRIDGISAGGETALLSATDEAYDLLAARAKKSANRIRAVVIMTDGIDNQSKITLDALVKKLGGENRAATVFTIAYGENSAVDAMKQISTAGAGSFSQGDVDSIIQVYRDLAAFF
jgi:Ca-activated chloride channel homolog